MLRATVLLLCTITLSACSYSYDVQAKVSDGLLTFDANPQWGADCVRQVEITSDEGEAGTRTEVVWKQAISHEDGCKNTFPIAYGEQLKGYPYVYGSGGVFDEMDGTPEPSVAATTLRLGVIYTVSTTTGATGYGCGKFRLGANRQVQNLGCS